MWVDSNTRGHHQWFYFSIENNKMIGKVRFNIVNFTKKASLYLQGQRICVMIDKDGKWFKGGENIQYR